MDTKILRQKILDLAIHGRLVPQDPNDEPASALLSRIRTEKEQLVKDGKLKKKDLVTTPVSDEDKPFEVPEGWEWCRLECFVAQVTDFVASGSFASLRENVKYYKEENYAVIVRTADFSNNFTKNLTYTDKHGYEFLKNSNLFGGELILSNIGASIGKVFIVPNLQRPMTLGPNSIMVKTYEKIHTSYLYLLFTSSWGWNMLHKISSSTAQGKFNKTDFKNVPIPLPPLSEQQRIVAAVEQWMSLVDVIESGKENLQQSIALAKNKILDLAIKGKLVEKEGEWEEKTLGEVCKVITGSTPSKSNPSYYNGTFPFVKPADLDQGRHVQTASDYLSEEGKSVSRIIPKGSVSVCCIGTIGKCGYLDIECTTNQQINSLIPCEKVIGLYLFYYCNSPYFQNQIKEEASAITISLVNKSKMQKILIPLPPLSEQRRIVAKVEEIFAQLDNIAQALK